MQAHGKRKIVVPPKLAYGSEGYIHRVGLTKVVVPPNATLLFYVELMQAGKYHRRQEERQHDEL